MLATSTTIIIHDKTRSKYGNVTGGSVHGHSTVDTKHITNNFAKIASHSGEHAEQLDSMHGFIIYKLKVENIKTIAIKRSHRE